MPDGSTVNKKGRKFDQVLEGARTVFLSVGYEGASVDEIAREAGVSKATLYSYFADKRELFMHVARAECNLQADRMTSELDLDGPFSDALNRITAEIVTFITSPFAQRIFRICVAEGERFPEIGQQFYESGPAMAREHLKELFRLGVAKGALDIDDFDLAADQLAELCKADIFPRMVFSLSSDFSDAEKARVSRGAARMFLARYGTET